MGRTKDKYTKRIKYPTAKAPSVMNPWLSVKGVSKREPVYPSPIDIIVNSKATEGSIAVACIAAEDDLKPST